MPDIEDSAPLDQVTEVKVTEEEELSDDALDSVSGGVIIIYATSNSP